MEKIWFITGASKGFGLTLAKRLLKEGYKVAGTSRDITRLNREIGPVDENFLPLAVDLLDEDSVERALYDTVKHFGRIDVIVNSAKYGLAGNVEELSDRETRRNFDVNVFGALNVVRSALPYLREQASGHIFNISSVGGYTGDKAGFGIYRATELAVIGFSESLAAEVKPFGIKVTTVAPGYFRNNLLPSETLVLPKKRIAGYKQLSEIGPSPEISCGSEKAADRFIEVAEQEPPQAWLFLGQDGCNVSKVRAINSRMQQLAYGLYL